jgi:hypothetical protein
MLTVTKVNNHNYDVFFGDLLIGKFVQDIDGYFYFYSERSDGAWADYTLKALSDELAKLNKPWEDMIRNYFKTNRDKTKHDDEDFIND